MVEKELGDTSREMGKVFFGVLRDKVDDVEGPLPSRVLPVESCEGISKLIDEDIKEDLPKESVESVVFHEAGCEDIEPIPPKEIRLPTESSNFF
ncbi:MAG: hypothetical protein RXP92_01765 [Candidatus Micrarchaeota archaeon]